MNSFTIFFISLNKLSRISLHTVNKYTKANWKRQPILDRRHGHRHIIPAIYSQRYDGKYSSSQARWTTKSEWTVGDNLPDLSQIFAGNFKEKGKQIGTQDSPSVSTVCVSISGPEYCLLRHSGHWYVAL